MALFLMLFGMVAFSRVIFSGGLRTIRRYLRRRRAELLEPAIAAEIDLLLGWSAVVGGYLWLFLSLVAVLIVLVPLGSYLGVWPRDEQNYSLFYERGPRLDMIATVIAALALLSLGVGTVRWGYRRLRPFRPALGFIQPDAAQRRRRVLLFGCLRIIGGGVALLAVIFFATEVLVRVECMAYSRTLPDWVPAHWWSLTDMLKACQINDKADFIFDLVVAVIVGLGALAFAVNWLLRGVRAVLGFVGRGSGRSTETELSLSSTLRGRVT
jgi:hypothetical protein